MGPHRAPKALPHPPVLTYSRLQSILLLSHSSFSFFTLDICILDDLSASLLFSTLNWAFIFRLTFVHRACSSIAFWDFWSLRHRFALTSVIYVDWFSSVGVLIFGWHSHSLSYADHFILL